MQANPTQLMPRAQQRGAAEHQPVPGSRCGAPRGWMGLCAGLLSDSFCSPSCSAPTASRYRAETKGFFSPPPPPSFFLFLITLSTPNPGMICAFHTLSVLLLSVRIWILSISQLKTLFSPSFSFLSPQLFVVLHERALLTLSPPVWKGLSWLGCYRQFWKSRIKRWVSKTQAEKRGVVMEKIYIATATVG